MTADYTVRNYPGAAVKTRLTTGMTNIDTTTTIEVSTGWPTANFWMLIDAGLSTEELVFVATRSALTLSGIIRNVTGGGAFTHSALGSNLCYPTASAQDFTEANAVAAALTTKGDSLWKGGTLSVAPARLAAGSDQQIIRYLAANALGVETTWLGSIPVFASTGARDTAIPSPLAGQTVYIDSGTATEGWQTFNGASWRPVAWNAPWGRIASAAAVASQGSITAVVDLTSMSVTFTAVTRRIYRVNFQGVLSSTVGTDAMAILLTDGSNVQKSMARTQGAGSNLATATGVVEFSSVAGNALTAGSVTLKLRAQRTSGTGTVTNTATATEPTLLVIEDIGPDTGAPA